MELEWSDDYSLEWAAIQEDSHIFTKVFGRELIITVSSDADIICQELGFRTGIRIREWISQIRLTV